MGNINVILDGETYSIPEEQVDAAVKQGARLESDVERADRLTEGIKEETYGGAVGTIAAAGAGALRGLSLGGFDAAARALGGEEELRELKQRNPVASAIGDAGATVGAAVLSGGTSLLARTPAAAAARLGASVARAGEGAGALAKVGRAAAGGAAEGALYGAGQAVSELALSEDPITIDRVAGALSSRMLFGGGVGAAAGSLAKVAEIGLTKAKAVLDDAAIGGADRARAVAAADDLAALDAKGLRAARKTEETSFKTAQADELTSIEKARATQRKSVVDDLDAFTREVKEAKHHLTTGGLKLPAAEGKLATTEISKISIDANRFLNRIVRNPLDLADNLKPALAALRQQEYGFNKLLERGDDLRAVFATDARPDRLRALESIGGALEKNRALQARIQDLMAKPASDRLTKLAEANAARLAAIDEAKDALVTAAAKPKSLMETVASGTVFGAAAGAVRMVPFVGGAAAPFVGAKAAEFVGAKVFGRLAKTAAEAAERTSRAVSAFVDVTRKAAPRAPVVATKVLSHVAFAPGAERKELPRGAHRQKLAPLFHARADEIRTQIASGPDGRAVMRPEARAQVAERLAPIRAFMPLLADRLESIAARRIEFLADRMPRRPDVAGMPIGPDIWQPSEMQMRTWARYVAAVEDPGGIEERLVDGSVTPEDAEVMREVYPERMAEITQQIIMQLPTLRQSLPYHRRLALSVFSGVPVDPALDPRVLDVLQSSFTAEPGTSGGIAPPKPVPQFGSVRAEGATPAQSRAQGATA